MHRATFFGTLWRPGETRPASRRITPDSDPATDDRSSADHLGNRRRRKSSLRKCQRKRIKENVRAARWRNTYDPILSLPRYHNDISDLALTRARSLGQEINKEWKTGMKVHILWAVRIEVRFMSMIDRIRHSGSRTSQKSDVRNLEDNDTYDITGIQPVDLINRILRWEQLSLTFISITTFILFLRRQVHRRGERPELGEMN